MKFCIPVRKTLFRKFEDPLFEKSRVLHLYPRVVDLPRDIPDTPDPRRPKDDGPVVKRISQSLASNDGRFHLLNRGITISVFNYEYDANKQVLTLDLPEGDEFISFGVIDGGHSYRTITTVTQRLFDEAKAREEEGIPLENQHVHLEILVQVQRHLADIAEARNFSVSLKPWTLAGYRDKFKWFLAALGGDYTQYIKISENDKEPVGILDLIQVMSAINPILFKDGEPALEAYKNAGKCLDYFTEKDDRYEFRRLAPVAKDVVRLYDYVRYSWKNAYNSADETGRFGKLGARREFNLREKNRAAMATYYFLDPQNGPVVGKKDGKDGGDFPVEKGFAIPAISSLRPLLVKDDKGNFKWYTDPFKFWDLNGPRLVRLIMAASEAVGYNPHTVGRDPRVYSELYGRVRTSLLETLLAEQGRTLPF